MPRAKKDSSKTSAELDAEIEDLKKVLAEKQKVKNEVKRREDAQAEQARAVEEAQFNRDFVAKAREISWGDYEDEGQTVYEVIRNLIRPPVPLKPERVAEEPEQEAKEPEQPRGSLMGPYMDLLRTHPT